MLAGRPTGQPAWGDFAPGPGRRSCDRLPSRSSDSRFETLNSVLDPCWTHVGKGSYLGPLGLPGCKTRIGQFRGGSMVALWWLRGGSGLQNGPVAIPGAIQTIVFLGFGQYGPPRCTLHAHCAHTARTLYAQYTHTTHFIRNLRTQQTRTEHARPHVTYDVHAHACARA